MYELYEINKKSCVFLNTLCKYKTIEIVKPLCKYSFKSFKKFIYDLYWSFITNGKAKIYIILDNNNEIIHSSYVIPHCYKFPFLRGGDIMIYK